MYIHGSFLTRYGEECEVRILTGGDASEEIEIGGEGSILQWSDSPVQIDSSVNDTFDVLLQSSCTITLHSLAYIEALHASTPTDVVVNIFKAGECIWAGFGEPMTYDQAFAEKWDDIEISCVDVLSALSYYRYGGVGESGVDYSSVRSASTQATFSSILQACLSRLTSSLVIDDDGECAYWFDCSKTTEAGGAKFGVFDIAVSELLFYGDEEDDTMTMQEVVEEVLRYLNLHICQRGYDFYVFDWATIKAGGTTAWADIYTGAALSTSGDTITLTNNVVEDDKASISVEECYSRVELTADITELEDVVESPMDEGALTSPFAAKQKYMTEIFAHGEGTKACDAFTAMLNGDETTYENAYMRDHYARVMAHESWTFNLRDGNGNVATFATDELGTYQWYHLVNLKTYPMSCGLVQLGSVEWQPGDGAPTDTPSMSTCLCVCVGGGQCRTDSSPTYSNNNELTEAMELARMPIAEYTGTETTGSLSPLDDDTTNYIVISGEVALCGCYTATGAYGDLLTEAAKGNTGSDCDYWHDTVYSRENDDGRYYVQEGWKAVNPTDEPEAYEGECAFMLPHMADWMRRWPDNKSYTGSKTAQIAKIPVLACMLRVGTKVCVEHQADAGTAVYCADLSGAVSEYTWQSYKSLDECEDEAEYYSQCIYIGFKPGYDSYVIDEEYDILNNVTSDMNIDAEGTAIPITKADALSGAVSFQILGPVQTVYDYEDGAYKYPVPFYSQSEDLPWNSSGSSVPWNWRLMNYVSNIFVKDIEVKIYSDNAGYEAVSADGEVVYYSDTSESYVNVKSASVKINTALTSEECYSLGVSNGVNVSNTTLDGALLASIYDVASGETAKPEAFYVDAYYNEYHAAKVILDQNMQDRDGLVSPFNLYYHPALDKTFYVQGVSYNIVDGSAEMTLKEL